jgi:hypothetical protein
MGAVEWGVLEWVLQGVGLSSDSPRSTFSTPSPIPKAQQTCSPPCGAPQPDLHAHDPPAQPSGLAPLRGPQQERQQRRRWEGATGTTATGRRGTTTSRVRARARRRSGRWARRGASARRPSGAARAPRPRRRAACALMRPPWAERRGVEPVGRLVVRPQGLAAQHGGRRRVRGRGRPGGGLGGGRWGGARGPPGPRAARRQSRTAPAQARRARARARRPPRSQRLRRGGRGAWGCQVRPSRPLSPIRLFLAANYFIFEYSSTHEVRPGVLEVAGDLFKGRAAAPREGRRAASGGARPLTGGSQGGMVAAAAEAGPSAAAAAAAAGAAAAPAAAAAAAVAAGAAAAAAAAAAAVAAVAAVAAAAAAQQQWRQQQRYQRRRRRRQQRRAAGIQGAHGAARQKPTPSPAQTARSPPTAPLCPAEALPGAQAVGAQQPVRQEVPRAARGGLGLDSGRRCCFARPAGAAPRASPPPRARQRACAHRMRALASAARPSAPLF